jgi:hypothetical protein
MSERETYYSLEDNNILVAISNAKIYGSKFSEAVTGIKVGGRRHQQKLARQVCKQVSKKRN